MTSSRKLFPWVLAAATGIAAAVAGGSLAGQSGSNGPRAILKPGQHLATGESLRSPSRQYVLAMQSDGNLVLYVGKRPLWSSQTHGHGAVAVMAHNGDLVVRSHSGHRLWDSATAGHPGSHLVLQDDGNLVIYTPSGSAPWYTGTYDARLGPGETLNAGQYLRSPSAQYRLLMQTDGNLVLYTNGHALWDAHTGGHPGAHAVMRKSGNLVVVGSSGHALWRSKTHGNPGAYLAVQDDGNLVVYAQDGSAPWYSSTFEPALYAGDQLNAGQYIRSPNGQYKLIMQSDGNLVLYDSKQHPTWNAQTAGKSGAFAVMQSDGNFVVYTPDMTPWFDSHTGGNPGAYLALQDDGNLVVYSAAQKALWDTGTVGGLQLPFAVGQSWTLHGGPHNTNGCGYNGLSCSSGHPWNSIDLVGGDNMVRAAGSGTVQLGGCPAKGLVIIDHGGGWHTTYYHLDPILVHAGDHVNTGDPLGVTSKQVVCGGTAGDPPMRHVHFSVLKYTGAYSWQSGGVDLDGFQLGNWVFHDGTRQYNGCATNVVTHKTVCQGDSIYNDG